MGLVLRIGLGLGLRLYGNSRPIAAMPSLLMNIWDATFKEKGGGRADISGLHERPRCHGSLNQTREPPGRRLDRVLSTATT
jgi:hypothetical protein